MHVEKSLVVILSRADAAGWHESRAGGGEGLHVLRRRARVRGREGRVFYCFEQVSFAFSSKTYMFQSNKLRLDERKQGVIVIF